MRSTRCRAAPLDGHHRPRPAAFRKALDDALDEARKLEDEFISVEHLLLALDIVPRDALLDALKEVRGGQRVTTQDPEGTYEALDEVSAAISPLPPRRASSIR